MASMDASGSAALLMLDAAGAQTYLAQLRDGYRRERSRLLQRVADLEAQLHAKQQASPLHDQRLRGLQDENLRLKVALQQEVAARQQLQRNYDTLLELLRQSSAPVGVTLVGPTTVPDTATHIATAAAHACDQEPPWGPAKGVAAEAVASPSTASIGSDVASGRGASPPAAGAQETSGQPSTAPGPAAGRLRGSSCESDAAAPQMLRPAAASPPPPPPPPCSPPAAAMRSDEPLLGSPWLQGAADTPSPLAAARRHRASEVSYTASPAPKHQRASMQSASAYFPSTDPGSAAAGEAGTSAWHQQQQQQQPHRRQACLSEDSAVGEEDGGAAARQPAVRTAWDPPHSSSTPPAFEPGAHQETGGNPAGAPTMPAFEQGPLRRSLPSLVAVGLGASPPKHRPGALNKGTASADASLLAAGIAPQLTPAQPGPESAIRRVARPLWQRPADTSVRSSAPTEAVPDGAAAPAQQQLRGWVAPAAARRGAFVRERPPPEVRRSSVQMSPQHPSAAILDIVQQRRQRHSEQTLQRGAEQQTQDEQGQTGQGRGEQAAMGPAARWRERPQGGAAAMPTGMPAWMDGLMSELNADSSSGNAGSSADGGSCSDGRGTSSSESVGHESPGVGSGGFWGFGGRGLEAAVGRGAAPPGADHRSDDDSGDGGASDGTSDASSASGVGSPLLGELNPGFRRQVRRGGTAAANPVPPLQVWPLQQGRPHMAWSGPEPLVAPSQQRQPIGSPMGVQEGELVQESSDGGAGATHPLGSARSRREALASLSQVHAQLSSKVQLLQALAPRLSVPGPSRSRASEARAAAAVAAAAAALAAAGTRAAEEVGAAAAAAAEPPADTGGTPPHGTGSGEAVQDHLVQRMAAIHSQLRNLCTDMLAGALDDSALEDSRQNDEQDDGSTGDAGGGCPAGAGGLQPASAGAPGWDAAACPAERSWGSDSASV